MIKKLGEIGRLLWAIITAPYGIVKVASIAGNFIERIAKIG